ncbi:MAG: YlbL family protein [Pseudonocardiaceae bacterium]
MNRRTWTMLVSLGLAMTFGLLGGVATVPYVALRPGPTFDTLGVVDGTTVVDIQGTQTYPTAGHLNMTTVSVLTHITLYGAMGLWASGSSALVPREEIFPPNLSEQQIEQQNQQLFQDSESQAEAAALRYLGYPTRVVVDRILPDGAAREKLTAADALLTLDGQEVSTAQQVVDSLEGTRPGQIVQVGFQRGDTPVREVAVELGSGPQPDRGYLGLGLADQPDVDFDITISLADVGGPSAGLMFALSIVDKLTPGPLAGDTFVAGTGEIQPTGEVGPIGGIPFKMIRARQAGATVFLVPAGNCDEAVARVPEGLALVRVESLAGAVNALDALRAGEQPPTCAP